MYGTTLPVRAMPSSVRPWNAAPKATTAGRPVAVRAILTAFSTASAPVVKRAVFLAKSPGASWLIRSASWI
ncbi:Uncharacterised protein [Bordetella pertussis]|nr:Uncharacterised protein [Bordetella pertussis]